MNYFSFDFRKLAAVVAWFCCFWNRGKAACQGGGGYLSPADIIGAKRQRERKLLRSWYLLQEQAPSVLTSFH